MAAVNTVSKSTPKEAQIMAAILKDMGVNEYEPRVINQMMEFSYREHALVMMLCGASVWFIVYYWHTGGVTVTRIR